MTSYNATKISTLLLLQLLLFFFNQLMFTKITPGYTRSHRGPVGEIFYKLDALPVTQPTLSKH